MQCKNEELEEYIIINLKRVIVWWKIIINVIEGSKGVYYLS